MVYDPANYKNISFTGTYEPPRGDGIEIRLGDFSQVCEIFIPGRGLFVDFDFTDTTLGAKDFEFLEKCYPADLPEIIVPKCEEVKPYFPPKGTEVDFHFYKEYTPPSGWVELDLADCLGDVPPETPVEPPPWYEIPSSVSPGIRVGYKTGSPVDVSKTSRWNDSKVLEPSFRLRGKIPRDLEANVSLPWEALNALYKENRIAFDRLAITDKKVRSLWRFLEGLDKEFREPWDELTDNEKNITAGFKFPPAKDRKIQCKFDELSNTDKDPISIPWRYPPPLDVNHRTMWGQKTYEEICLRDYEPPQGDMLNVDLTTELADVGDKDHCDVWFDSLSYDLRCSQDEPSGWRDAYFYRPPVLYPQTPIKKLWFNMNSAFLTKVVGNVPLSATSITVSTDFGSWCWGFEAVINNLESFLAIEPGPNGNHIVKVTLNGYDFLCEVEEANEQNMFGQKSWKVSGRSISAELAAPTAPKTSYVEVSARTAIQLIEAQLLNTGWDLSYETIDWLVSAGAFTFNNKAPMAAIKQIAEAVKGCVQTVPGEKTLRIIPRYIGNPWDWGTVTPDLAINESVVRVFGHKSKRGADYNAVFVTGTTQGVMAKVLRAGSAGDKNMPMITNPLLTDVDAARECGRCALASAGAWKINTLNMPLMAIGQEPSLLLPGMILEVLQARGTWRGQVTANRVTGIWGKGLSVRQSVTVERYLGD